MTESTQHDTTPATSEDEFAALALLAGLQGNNTVEIEMLRILTDPENNADGFYGDTRAEIFETIEDEVGDYTDWTFNSNVKDVAEILFSHYSRMQQTDPAFPDFMFGFDCDVEGSIGGFTITAGYGPWAERIKITESAELKNATWDRDAKGIQQAIGIARSLTDYFTRCIETAEKYDIPARLAVILAEKDTK